MDVENYNFLLIHLVNEFIKSRGMKNPDRSQFLNEAKFAAWKAIGDYKEEKLVKITTYISTCVINHLSNINKSNSRNDARLYHAQTNGVELQTRKTHQSIEDLEFLLTMRSILTPHEYNVFEMRFVQDCSLVDIQKAFGMSRREVEKCCRHICQKYTSLEENLNRTLMQRQLQSKWLEDSQE